MGGELVHVEASIANLSAEVIRGSRQRISSEDFCRRFQLIIPADDFIRVGVLEETRGGEERRRGVRAKSLKPQTIGSGTSACAKNKHLFLPLVAQLDTNI